MDPLFQPLPEDIASLTDDQIQALIDENLEVVQKIKDQDEGLMAGRDTTAVVAELQAGVDGIKSLRAELTTREQLRAEADAAIQALTDEAIGTTEPEGEEEPAAEPAAEEPAEEPAVEEEPQAIAASARRTVPFRTTRREPAPVVVSEPEPTASLVASGGIDGFKEGAALSRRTLAEALIAKRGNMIATPDGHEEKVRVARATFQFPEDRTLGNDPYENWEKAMNVVSPYASGKNLDGEEALVASGGLCAPVTPYYDLELVATTARPVRDMLPVFNAARGGITFAPPPGLASVTTAVGYLTAAQDKTGGTTGAKTCQTIPCPSFSEVDVAMIYECLRFGNLGARAWPEQVTQFEGLAAAAFARLAETKLLDGISAASIKTTGATWGGAVSTILGQIQTAAAGQRNRLRMSPDAVLRFVGPAWLRDMLQVDVVRSQFDRFGFADGDVDAYFRGMGIVPTWTIDGSTTPGGQVFGVQTAAALLPFPTTVQWWLFPEGSFLYLDAGTLDVGLVRDSTLNLTNDFQMFNEGFENIAFVGVESIQCISTTCANGQVTAPIVAPSCQA